MLSIIIFTHHLGPLTRGDTNIILGALHGSSTSGKFVSRYTDVRESVIQNWIKDIVPDVEINGRLR